MVGVRQEHIRGFVVDVNGERRRFLADGTPDAGFGDGGTSPLPLLDGTATLLAGAALQGDGKVVVACNRNGGGWQIARFLY